MSKRKSPRPDDVARWVDTLARPIPENYGGAALSAIRQERRNAAGKLAEWGLGRDGKPKGAAPAPKATVPCLCGSLTCAIVDVGDGLPRTDCCHAY